MIMESSQPNRKKVPAKPGFGLYDWMKIVNTGRNLSGTNGNGKYR
jgi:hypothetical protein